MCERACVKPHSGKRTPAQTHMGGGGHSPSTTGKVNLFNINSGSGHHADYATITILCSAAKDRPRPLAHTLSTLPSSHVHLELKPPAREPCRRLPQTHINTSSRNRPPSRSNVMVLARTQGPLPLPLTPAPSANTCGSSRRVKMPSRLWRAQAASTPPTVCSQTGNSSRGLTSAVFFSSTGWRLS